MLIGGWDLMVLGCFRYSPPKPSLIVFLCGMDGEDINRSK